MPGSEKPWDTYIQFRISSTTRAKVVDIPKY